MTNGPSTHDFAAMSVRDFCAALAAKTSAPGGGAVAGVTAAHAASLLAMVVEYSRGKASFAALEPQADAIVASLRIAAEAGLVAAKSDADAYAALSGLWKKPKDDPERIARWTSAVRDAIAAPHLIVELAAELAARCRFLAGRTTKALDSDLAIAADLAACAARAAGWNVRVNAPSLADAGERAALVAALDARLATIRSDLAEVEAALVARG